MSIGNKKEKCSAGRVIFLQKTSYYTAAILVSTGNVEGIPYRRDVHSTVFFGIALRYRARGCQAAYLRLTSLEQVDHVSPEQKKTLSMWRPALKMMGKHPLGVVVLSYNRALPFQSP
nr:unnamed protein product [Callosobruchus chinensis]